MTLFLTVGTASGKEPVSFDGESIKEIIALLASAEFEGRKSGSRGAARAAEYLASELKKAGLQPGGPDSSFRQVFKLEFFQVRKAGLFIDNRLSTEAFSIDRHFTPLRQSIKCRLNSPAVYAGHGLRLPGYDDFKQLETKDRLILISWDLPPFLAGRVSSEQRLAGLAELNPAGLLVFARESDPFLEKARPDLPFPVLSVGREIADFLLMAKGKSVNEMEQNIRENQLPLPLELNALVSLELDTDYDPHRHTENLFASIPGSDPQIGAEIIMVGAHYDHLGKSPDQGIYYGANDNASGTAVLLEVLKKLAGRRPGRRTIMAAFWSAEESNLQGTNNFFNDPFIETALIKAYLNLDMVGQGKNTVNLLYDPARENNWRAIAAQLPPDVLSWIRTGDYAGQSSDHLVFSKRGIPSFLFGSPRPPYNYHTVFDRVELINPISLARTALALFHCLSVLAEIQ